MSFIKRNGKIYLSEVENIRIGGKVVQRHIRYIGKEADGKTILLANKIGLPSILGEYAGELLSLVYAHCIDYRSINQMTHWFQRADLNLLLNLEGVTEARFLNPSSTSKNRISCNI